MSVVLTTVGKDWIVDKLDETLSTNADWITWGSGTGTAAVGDTDIFGAVSEARVQGVMSQPSADVFQCVGTMTADGTKTITNAGLFTASAAGTLVIHGDFTGVDLNANDQIQFTFQLQIT